MVGISQKDGKKEVPLLKLVVNSIGTGVLMRTFDMVVNAHLGGISLQSLKYKGENNLLQAQMVDFLKCFCVVLLLVC